MNSISFDFGLSTFGWMASELVASHLGIRTRCLASWETSFTPLPRAGLVSFAYGPLQGTQ